jgi:hypothetical protein
MSIIRPMAVLSLVAATVASAQERRALPQPASSADFVRAFEARDPAVRGGAYETAVRVLTGDPNRPDLSADAVARQLVEIAVSSRVYGARIDAAAALIRSGHADQTRRYADVVPRLREIYSRASTAGIKSLTRGGIVETASPREAFDFLRPIAETFDPRFPTEQYAAINLIAQLNTPYSVAFLRDLDSRGTVTHERAVASLRRHAANGYRTPPKTQAPPAA